MQVYLLSESERIEKYVNQKRNCPCMDCGINYYYNNNTNDQHKNHMTFDHVRGEKKFGIGKPRNMKKYSLHEYVEEINKCEVVCRECHDKREIKRGIMQERKRGLLVA